MSSSPEFSKQQATELLDTGAGIFNDFLESRIAPFIRARAVSQVAEPMLYSLSAGGKRIRPFLCIICAGVDPSKKGRSEYLEQALFAAAAIESIHTYSLIHDDLPAMDDDSLRRGRPSCHVQFSEWAAILAGDALNTVAFDLLCEASFPPLLTVKMIRILASAAGISGMICGQTLDLHAEKNRLFERERPEVLKPMLEEIHLKKTAAMTRASCEMGALIAGCKNLGAYRDFGEKLGLLFQISDDILDVVGESQILGKTVGKDAESGKLTYPGLYGLETSRTKCKEIVEQIESLLPSLDRGDSSPEDMRSVLGHLPSLFSERKK